MTDHPRLIAFDLDDTLAPSKSPMPARMGAALTALLESVPVCIISGGHFGQFRDQVLAHLPAGPEQLTRLHLMPTCGTRYLRHDGTEWGQVYAHDLTDAERVGALAAVEGEARRLGLWEERTWGEILEDRGSQITFSALGQQAPLAAKKAWDPTGEKKARLRDAVAALLPDLEVRSGGSTSVDITRAGVDKAYGMERLAEQTGIALPDMLFVGDRLDPAGNDYPVVRLGLRTRAVKDWQETAELVEGIVAGLAVTRA
ncbi:HAD-IIB family hydrolase [Georgenia sp. AZ-5]|uniref:HAD-IIB family hydrolase n=1 Tax=Georgenia sp. AZ-5 TaxID=3367526 RepID=UPI00375434CE